MDNRFTFATTLRATGHQLGPWGSFQLAPCSTTRYGAPLGPTQGVPKDTRQWAQNLLVTGIT
jgi:hypothetical protein